MTTLAHIGGPLGCFGLAALLIGTNRWLRLAGLAAVGLGALFLVLYLAPHGHHAAYAGAAVLGVAAALVGAWLLRRRPWLLVFASLLLAPARVPVTVGSTEANLLIPLYVVVAAAFVLLGWQLIEGDGRSRELGPVALPLALFVAWTGLSLSWTIDLKQGSVQLLFFYLPFGLLAICLARLPWRPKLLPALYLELAAMGVLFAVVGLYQRAAHHVFWNAKVIVGNAYQSFFRVNSLFWDPSIYGRFLVIVILVSVVVVLATRDRRTQWFAVSVIALSWVGLFFSYSQSSFAALFVGLLVAGGFAVRPRTTAAATAATLLALGFAGYHPLRSAASPGHVVAASNAGSRSSLVKGGIRIALDHPLGGVGIGGFTKSYAGRHALFGLAAKKAASHTTPVTVAAETGVPGFLLFCWLAIAGFVFVFRRASLVGAGVPALAFGLTLLAIAVHSLGYNSLFEDPMGWGSLGLAACLAAATERRKA
jgi:O-antigen ligase/polysaccharide polymerase Wzy-like membrane protein